MKKEAHAQLRRSQLITTYGPGALIDLPKEAGIMGGLDDWPKEGELDEIVEPRLAAKLAQLTGATAPRLYSPPLAPQGPQEKNRGVTVWRFPNWFVVQDEKQRDQRKLSRLLVQRRKLEEVIEVRKREKEKLVFSPVRFVRTCRYGHIDDIDWRGFVHHWSRECNRQLWLDETGTSGDLADLVVRCDCDASRVMSEAAAFDSNPLGLCSGARPWLGGDARERDCKELSRLLIRTAANAYFPQVWSALSLPDRSSAVQDAVNELWSDLGNVDDAGDLRSFKKKPHVNARLQSFHDDEILAAIQERKSGAATERPVKQVELEALLAQPEGYGDDVPIDPNFHARRLPDHAWRKGEGRREIASVTQVHRLREVMALAGFSRLEALTPDIQGEHENDIVRAPLALNTRWFPAVENRGEGIFVQLCGDRVSAWLERDAVKERLEQLVAGHERWDERRRKNSQRKPRPYPGGPYVLLHTLSHLLLQTVALRCGYPASSIKERIYVEPSAHHYGILLYTASPDAEGTLGGLVQQARDLEAHLEEALRAACLCSNDPICAQHVPTEQSLEGRDLHGAACHGCTLIAETSCEMRNDYLDRALVVPVLGHEHAAFFEHRG